jgi:hypothetical protein
MKLHPSFFGAFAAILAVGLASAQTPSPAQPHDHATASGSATQPAATDHRTPLTLAGCLMRQKDVPVSSKSGPAGYLLVAVRIVSHHQNLAGMRATPISHDASPPHAHDAPKAATTEPAAVVAIDSPKERIADSQMFKLAGVPLERLAKMNGRLVQVAGHIDASTVVDTDRKSNPRSTDDLGPSTFVAMSIDVVDGTCPKP